MTQHETLEKVARFEAALNQFIERIAEDRYLLAVVQVAREGPKRFGIDLAIQAFGVAFSRESRP